MATALSAAALQARDEAYASAPVGREPVSVIELDTAAFDKPLFFISGVEQDTAIVLETGEPAVAIACAFGFTSPGFESGGPTPAKLAIDAVSGEIVPYLKMADAALKVTYRAYLGDDRSTVVDLIDGLLMKRVAVGSSTAEGELTFAEIATQAFPRRTYDIDTYPATWIS